MQHDFILLDRSGSMQGQWVEAINSINSYVEQLAKDNVDTGVTLAAFDSSHTGGLEFQIVRDRIIPSTWRKVTDAEITPRNGTPLNDATAQILTLAEAGGYEKCALIIMTDGEENSSKEYSTSTGGTAKIKARLDAFRAKGFQVIFLGANFDNQHQALSYGAARGQTISSTAVNLGNTMKDTATLRASYSTFGTAMNFTDEQKKKATEDSTS